ncbi:beta strand repeat-containing protein, partial [Methylobacterium aquaticum]|uniref:beta strand repeat-containing protein n=1 Tax=Methylobacterium aquaticum TaxID=270351 RepID=UPI003CCA3B35
VAAATNTISNDIVARIGGTTGGLAASGSVTVRASEAASLTSRAATASLAASFSPYGFSLAGGGAITVDRVDSRTSATITSRSAVTAGGDVTVDAQDTTSVDSAVVSISVAAGIIALAAGGAVTDATVTPTVTAAIDGAEVTGATVTVRATATPGVHAKASGINVGTAAVGASTALARVGATVAAFTRDATITAANLAVQANLAEAPDKGSAFAEATGSAGGLIGLNSTVTQATNDSSVAGTLDAGTVLTVAGTVTLAATARTQQVANASSASAGLVGAGATLTSATSNTRTSAKVRSTGAIRAGAMTVTASGSDDNRAAAEAGAYGLASGTAGSATSTSTGSTQAGLEAGAQIDLTLTPAASGLLYMAASHVASGNGQVITSAYGALAGSGAVVRTDFSHDTGTTFGAGSSVLARGVQASAQNSVIKPVLPTPNIVGTTGGLASGAGADSRTTIAVSATVTVADSTPDNPTQIETVGGIATPGGITLSALNLLDVSDKVTLKTGGALAGAGTTSSIVTNAFAAQVLIGENASLYTPGTLTASANGRGNASAAANSDTYGAATVASGNTLVDLRPTNAVTVARGASVTAYGDVNLLAGSDRQQIDDLYVTSARTDTFAGSVIPIQSISADINVHQTNTITVAAGAGVATAGDANLITNRLNLVSTDAKAKGTNWLASLLGAINSLFGGSAEAAYTGTAVQGGVSRVLVDGSVTTGIARNIAIAIDQMAVDPNTGTTNLTGTVLVNGQQLTAGGALVPVDPAQKTFSLASGDSVTLKRVPITVSFGSVYAQSALIDQLYDAQDKLKTYSQNATLQNFYRGEVQRLTDLLQSQGLAQVLTAGNEVTVLPLQKERPAVTIGRFTAGAGRINIVAGQLVGAGSLDAQSDTKVEINNYSSATLTIGGITMPESNGGTFYNGQNVTRSEVLADKLKAIADENALLSPSLSADAVNFGVLTSGGVVSPNTASQITLSNWLGATAVNNTLVPAPTLNIAGDIIAVNANLYTTTVGGGDLVIGGMIRVKNSFTDVGGSVTIKDQTIYAIGGNPYGIVAGAITGGDPNAIVDAGNAATVLGALQSAPQGSIIASGDIVINAQYLDVRGLIQSGRDAFTINILKNSDVAAEIEQIRRDPSRSNVIQSLTKDGYSAVFDRQNNRIVINEIASTGGKVTLTGTIVNTSPNKGAIRALGGYASVTVNNELDYDVVVSRIDVSQRGTGIIDITDLAYANTASGAVARKTLLTQQADGSVTSYQALIGASGQEINGHRDGGAITSYTPGAGLKDANGRDQTYRYAFTAGRGDKTTYTLVRGTSAWLGIQAFASQPADESNYDTKNVKVGALVPNSDYFYLDATGKGAYNYDSRVTINTAATEHINGRSWSTSTWYGLTTHYQETITITYTETDGTHSVLASYPISMGFIGGATASVTINSTGTGRVLLVGGIANTSGTTSITSGGAIQALSPTGTVSGVDVVLNAAGVIGQGSGAAVTDQALVVNATGSVAATTGAGTIYLRSTGDIAVDRITARDGYDVTLVARGDVKVATGRAGAISAGSLTVTAGGNVGAATDSGVLKLDTGSRQRDRVTITAAGQVGIEETAGDLRLYGLTANGNVVVKVDTGSLLNVNDVAVRDERVEAELVNGVWKDLALTGADADRKFNETLDAYESVAEQDYATYWRYRNLQADPSHYDPAYRFQFAAGSAELAAYQALYRQQGIDKGLTGSALDASVAQSIATLETSRTLQYQTLNAQYGKYGDSYVADLPTAYATYWGYRNQQANPAAYDPTFTVPVSQAERSGIRSAALQASLSGTLLTDYVAAQIAALETARNSAYQDLDAVFGSLGSSQIADFGARYDAYWLYRGNLASDGTPLLTPALQTHYQTYFTSLGTQAGKTGSDLSDYVTAQFAALQASRAAEFTSLKATFDRFGDVYNADLATHYATYWAQRATLDASGRVHLTAAERASAVDTFTTAGRSTSLGDAAIADYVASRLAAAEATLGAAYQALHARFGAHGDSNDAAYAQTLSATDRADYGTYWGYRNQQANPGVYNAAFAPRLTGDALATALVQYQADGAAALAAGTLTSAAIDAAVAAQVSTLQAQRNADYARLDTFFAPFNLGNTQQQNPHFFIDQAMRDAINASIKRWTQDELLNAVGQGLLKEATSTQVTKQDPVITGANVRLVVRGATGSGNIGSVDGVTVIDVAKRQPLSRDQLVALGAAERSDMVFLTAAPVEGRVDFDNVGGQGRITRTDGQDWDPSIFTVGGTLYIGGATQNATGETPIVYTIASVSGGVILTNAGQTFTAETAKTIILGQSVARGEGPRVTATVAFGADGTLTRSTGSFLDDGFAVGMLIGVAGTFGVTTANQTGATTFYTIASVTASTVTVVEVGQITAESARDVVVFQSALDPTNPGNLVKQVLIQGRKAVNLSASGGLDADADGQIFLGTQGGFKLTSVVSANGEEIRIKAKTGITNVGDANGATVRGGNLVLEGGDGGIGEAARVIGIDLKNTSTLTVRTAQDIFITERSGDLNLESAYSQSGTVTLVSDTGGILDGVATDTNKIVAGSVSLKAKGGSIGTAGDRIEMHLTGTVLASGRDGVYLEETSGSMNVLAVVASAGDVTLKAAVSILDAGDLVDPTDIDSTRSTGVDARPGINVTGNGITLIAGNTIGTADNNVDIDSRAGGDRLGAVSAQTTFGNLYLNEVTGDLALGTVGTGNRGVAFLTAADGSILNGLALYDDASKDAAATGSNLTSGKAYLIAKDDIGAGGKRIVARMSADNGLTYADSFGGIEGYSTAGSVYLWNIGGLRVGGVTTTTAPGFRAAGTLSIRTSSPLTIDRDIISGSDIVQTAGETGASGDDLTVLAGVTIFSTGGSVTLNAGDNLTVQAGAVIKALGAITLRGDYSASGTPDNTGTTIDLQGTYVGSSIRIEGGANGDTIRLDGLFTTGTRIITLDRNDVPVEGTLSLGGSLAIVGGDGSDTVTLAGHYRGGALSIDVAAPGISANDADTVTLAGLYGLTGELAVLTGTGLDRIALGGRYGSVADGVIGLGSLRIDAGDGTNSVTLGGEYAIGGSAQITTGGDDDTVTLTGTAKVGSLSIDAGDGTNTVTLDGDITVVDAAQITTGGDDDTVTLTGMVKAGSLAIMAGEGTNRVVLDGGFTVAGELAGGPAPARTASPPRAPTARG